jgi:NADPH-dependent 2,4-dienoyl-CoA reductase/sulfur reductase-like enzyme
MDTNFGMKRREFLGWAAAAGALALPGCASMGGGASKGKVVVVGGGFGGATAAKYIRMWSAGTIEVTLVDPASELVSCPLSNLVLGGSTQIAALTTSMSTLTTRHGVKHVRETAIAIDTDKRVVRLASGTDLPYDRLVLSPGIDLNYAQVPGMESAAAQDAVLHAWKAGPQTLALRRQLEAMPDGGTYAITIPVAPYRCPPGPYERACQVAWYFKRSKPRSKVLILDANPDVTSKAGLFKKAWNEEYKGIVEYRPNHAVSSIDAATRTVRFDVQDSVRADVLNVLPPQSAGAIARQAGVITANNRWCEVDFLTFESIRAKNVHILGDAIQIAPAMPKSASMANNHAKVAAAAIVAILSGQAPNPTPVCVNTCYSFITDKEVVHVASVHQYDKDKKTLIAVQGAGGLSPSMNALEGDYAWSWAKNVWADAMA